MNDYPRYYILGERPVKMVLDEKGGMATLAFNWETGEFELNWDAYLRVNKPGSDVERVSESEFEKHVEELRAKLEKK